MHTVQKTYTQEFKREAVRLAQSSGKPITQVARELGISDSSIHQWRKELAEHGPEAFPGSGHQTACLRSTRTPSPFAALWDSDNGSLDRCPEDSQSHK